MKTSIRGERFLRHVERPVQRVLASLGFELTRLDDSRVRYKNFADLCRAYEQRLRESGEALPDKETRIRLLGRLHGTTAGEAYYILRALAESQALVGDVCEFGVAQGETSALIANEIAEGQKTLHLFDSFQGLSAPTVKDGLKDDIFGLGSMEAYAGRMSYPEDMVRARLAAVGFPPHRYVLHKGFIEAVLRHDGALPTAVSFAYVDFDFYEPTKVVLEFLDRVISPGATIIVDDYDFFSAGSKAAVEEFIAARRGTAGAYRCHVPSTRYGHFAVLRRENGQ